MIVASALLCSKEAMLTLILAYPKPSCNRPQIVRYAEKIGSSTAALCEAIMAACPRVGFPNRSFVRPAQPVLS
jgi:hypothetical protein